jgi:hypothetical protein
VEGEGAVVEVGGVAGLDVVVAEGSCEVVETAGEGAEVFFAGKGFAVGGGRGGEVDGVFGGVDEAPLGFEGGVVGAGGGSDGGGGGVGENDGAEFAAVAGEAVPFAGPSSGEGVGDVGDGFGFPAVVEVGAGGQEEGEQEDGERFHVRLR